MHSTPIGRDSSIELAAVPAAVRQARQFAAETLTAGSAHPSVIETVVLLVSELATNAIPRTATAVTRVDEVAPVAPVATMAVRIASYPTGRVRIEVRDGDTSQVPEKQTSTPDDEHGRGLVLVDALSADWGYYTRAGLKTVWAEVDCAACLRSTDEPLRSIPAQRRPVALDSRRRRQVTVSARPARAPH